MNKNTGRWSIFIGFGLLSLTPWISSPIALTLGFLLSTFHLLPANVQLTSMTKKLLSYSIIGLGFGIHLDEAIAATSQGFGIIVTSIFCTLIFGFLIARFMQIERKTGHLIASGTAICGGSAIAAVAPAIGAKDQSVGLALACVFVLNSVALFVFPMIGHAIGMTQTQFGTWAAIAIHDTSSVVGAAGAYGEKALQIATTLKLARALWIVPVAFISALAFRTKNSKITIPYFIVFYILAIIFSDQMPQFGDIYQIIYQVSKQTLVLALFLIGCSISVEKLKAAGSKPLTYAVLLWVLISTASLSYILYAIK